MELLPTSVYKDDLSSERNCITDMLKFIYDSKNIDLSRISKDEILPLLKRYKEADDILQTIFAEMNIRNVQYLSDMTKEEVVYIMDDTLAKILTLEDRLGSSFISKKEHEKVVSFKDNIIKDVSTNKKLYQEEDAVSAISDNNNDTFYNWKDVTNQKESNDWKEIIGWKDDIEPYEDNKVPYVWNLYPPLPSVYKEQSRLCKVNDTSSIWKHLLKDVVFASYSHKIVDDEDQFPTLLDNRTYIPTFKNIRMKDVDISEKLLSSNSEERSSMWIRDMHSPNLDISCCLFAMLYTYGICERMICKNTLRVCNFKMYNSKNIKENYNNNELNNNEYHVLENALYDYFNSIERSVNNNNIKFLYKSIDLYEKEDSPTPIITIQHDIDKKCLNVTGKYTMLISNVA